MKERRNFSRVWILAFLLPIAWVASISATPVDDKFPEYLFVISAQSGEITKVSDHQYTLTLRHTDIDHILMFSDRPYRIARYITVDQLKDIWSQGENSFSENPPNAGLVMHGLK